MRAHFDVVTVVVDHADKLVELSWSGRCTKTEDGFDFLRLRLDSIRSDNMAEVFNFFDGEETFLGPDREQSKRSRQTLMSRMWSEKLLVVKMAISSIKHST